MGEIHPFTEWLEEEKCFSFSNADLEEAINI